MSTPLESATDGMLDGGNKPAEALSVFGMLRSGEVVQAIRHVWQHRHMLRTLLRDMEKLSPP